MGKYKPLVASFIVIAVAMAGLAAWRYAGTPAKPRPPADNKPVANAPPTNSSGIEFKSEPLEELPELDPLGLWPRDGQGVPSIQFWVTWETTDFARCRLLVTRNRLDWHDLGTTAGHVHYLPVNLGDFDSRATFAVEFEARGQRYRSAPRTVTFAKGTAFSQREVTLNAGTEAMATHRLGISSPNPGALSQESFRSFYFPEDVQPFVLPGDEAHVLFGLGRPDTVPAGGAIGFIEVFDAASVTSDRILVILRP